jgi:hypothetical protein
MATELPGTGVAVDQGSSSDTSGAGAGGLHESAPIASTTSSSAWKL